MTTATPSPSPPRRILLCATGLSPQIVTETLYALAVQGHWIPDEIHLITTREGRQRAELTLLDSDPEQRMFYRLCEDYGLDTETIRFDADTLHVIHDAAGRPLDDIRTPADNEATADAITAVVRQLTADPDTEIHASIAGGRKTMGFYLGYALSLFGRPRDRLSHVLVPAPFESHPQFFFPPKRARVLYDKSDRPMRTDEARISLADIPFVRLRDGLSDVIRDGGARFSEAVAQAQRNLGPPELVLDPSTRKVRCGGVEVELPPVDFAFYAWFARRALANKPGIRRKQVDAAEVAEFLAEYRALCDELSGDYERVDEAVRSALTRGAFAKYFDDRKAHLHSRLRARLGHKLAERYVINSPARGHGFSLELRPEQIRFEPEVHTQ